MDTKQNQMTVKELEFLVLETIKDCPLSSYQLTVKIKQCFNDFYFTQHFQNISQLPKKITQKEISDFIDKNFDYYQIEVVPVHTKNDLKNDLMHFIDNCMIYAQSIPKYASFNKTQS